MSGVDEPDVVTQLAEAVAEIERLTVEVADLQVRLAYERERAQRLRTSIDRGLVHVLDVLETWKATDLQGPE